MCSLRRYIHFILSDDVYESPPKRPTQITKEEAHSCDDTLDDNTRIVLQLDVFHHSDETAVRVSHLRYCV